MALQEVNAAKVALRTKLGQETWLRGVGFGIDDRGYYLNVSVVKITPSVKLVVPTEFEGFRVRVEVIGDVPPQSV
jgi:hypothetical protein